jgi:protein tyrosine/serine phosphatase
MTASARLDGIENFRDFGGYKARRGQLRAGRLFRSAQHTFASDSDLEHLHALNLAAIFDLRRPSERERRPSRRHPRFAGAVIEADGEYESDVRWEDFIRTSDHSAESFRGYLTEFYKTAPFAPRHIELFTRYFATLAQADGAVLVHCAGGKDRTGMICALTHHLAGVSEDDMMADFLATNSHVRLDVIGPAWAHDIGLECGREPKVENLVVAMSVEAGYLHAAFNAIRAQYGSLDSYLEKALGVDDARRAAIEERILE